MNLKIHIVFLICFLAINSCQAQVVEVLTTRKMESIQFKSLDGLEIEANYYHWSKKGKAIIVLCHQAGWSRGEYHEIAPKLLQMGYDCLAIDQRSGEKVNQTENVTMNRAKDLDKGMSFLDAEQDIVAAVRWAKRQYPDEKIILWGSSYAASLVLKVAQDEGVDKVLSFSPGEYFGDEMTLTDKIKELKIPVFITCAKKEIERTQLIFDVIPSISKIFFKPSTDGNHGSRALWLKFDDNYDYWKAVKSFLNN